MFKIEKVDENNRQRVIDSLKLDVIKHVFAFYDVQHDPEHTTMYAAFEDEGLKGYILIYTALQFPSIVLECEGDAAEKLIGYSFKDRFIMHAPPSLLPAIKRRFPQAKHYVEDWMIVRKGEANFFRSEIVHRLRSEDDASKLATLLSSREDRPRGAVNRYIDQISRMPVYGVFVNDEMVSYAGSFIQLPQVWMIGGVYTHPNHRNM